MPNAFSKKRNIVNFSRVAFDQYVEWLNAENLDTAERILALMEEIEDSPFEGSGKPEPLDGPFKGIWSRRINRIDRLLYKQMSEHYFLVISCKFEKSHLGDLRQQNQKLLQLKDPD